MSPADNTLFPFLMPVFSSFQVIEAQKEKKEIKETEREMPVRKLGWGSMDSVSARE